MSLIELTVIIVVVGILTAVAMKSMTSSLEDYRRLKTEREMHKLAEAIVGDVSQATDRKRSDFGYVGDIGAFPPTLDALISDPGYATWEGPYFQPGFVGDTIGHKKDEWGQPYTYDGTTIASTGNGTPITVSLADNASDYLLNRYYVKIEDVNDSLPGLVYKDSVKAIITIPNGVGGTLSKTYRPNVNGILEFDSLPVGSHQLRVIYEPANDTVTRYASILPRHQTLLPTDIKFTRDYFMPVVDAGLAFVTGSDTMSTFSPSCDGISFWIKNNTGSTRTISSIKLTWASPTSYYRYVKWSGTTVVSSNSPRIGSGQTAVFSGSQVIGHGQTRKIQIETFKSSASGGGSSVNMQNGSFTVEFSDGSIITVATGVCN